MSRVTNVTSYEQLYIDSTWSVPVDGWTRDVISPFSEEPVAHAALGGPQDIDRAVRAARRAFDAGPWPTATPRERSDKVRELGDRIFDRREDFAITAAMEVGTPVTDGEWRHFQAHFSKELTDYYAALADRYPWTQRASGSFADFDVHRLAVGVVGAIVPWNVPLVLTMGKLAPALVAGCTIVLKPAAETPLNAFMLAEIAHQIDLPPGVLNVVPAERDASESLVRHELVDKISFTGSTRAGRRIAALCGEQLKRCSLELGGKSAAIVLADADLDTTMRDLIPATIANNGQVCVNQTRILAPQHRHDEVVERISAIFDALTLGDPLDDRTDVGPLINATQRARVEAYIASGRRDGARVTAGGGRPDFERGFFVEPTVFANADNNMEIARQEIFGPVVVVIPFATEDEAIEIANDSPYGLAGSVWSSDVERAANLARRVRSGTMGVNISTLDTAAPFGGFKASGIGREYGPQGLDSFTEIQAVHHSRPSAAGH